MLPLMCVILSSSLKRVLKDQAAQAVTAAIDHAVQPINLHNNDSLLHGPFADIDLARMTVNTGHGASNQKTNIPLLILTHRLRRSSRTRSDLGLICPIQT